MIAYPITPQSEAAALIGELFAEGYIGDYSWLKGEFAKAPAMGFRFLATWEAGFRSMTTKEPLRTPADAKGKKLRTFPNEMMRWTLEAMGFNVQIMPLPEVYLAIQQGTVSGQENPVDTIHANKFYEVAPHVTLTKHTYSPIPLTISEKTWQKLSPADREAVAKAAKEAADFSRREVRAAEEAQLADMQGKGAKIARPNLGRGPGGGWDREDGADPAGRRGTGRRRTAARTTRVLRRQRPARIHSAGR